MSFTQGLPTLQEWSSGAMESRNILGNQHKESSNEQDCDATRMKTRLLLRMTTSS